MTDIASTQTAPERRYRRFLGAGTGSGLVGSICCVGSAITIGAGVSGLSFFTTWMTRYQIYFIAASIVLMAAWLARAVRHSGRGQGPRAVARQIWPQALTMTAMYVVTLLAGMAAAGFAGRG